MTIATPLSYETQSLVAKAVAETIVRLSPNLLREAVGLNAKIADPLVFRDALLTVGDVASSKLFRGRGETMDAILDPLLTVTPDDVHFEAFSLDESTYVRLSLRDGSIERRPPEQTGCANIEFSDKLRAGLAELRPDSDVGLQVGRTGLAPQSSARVTRDHEIELSGSWMHGFLGVQAAMRLPANEVQLAPPDLRRLIAFLRKHRAQKSPRGLRLQLTPARAPRAVLEPWDWEFPLKGSRYLGSEPCEVVIWGRRRLLLLERLLPHIERIRVRLLGTGQPSFWACDAGPITVWLGLSPWTEREWTAEEPHVSFAPPMEFSDGELDELAQCLAANGGSEPNELTIPLGWMILKVDGALAALCAQGRAMYDPDRDVYYARSVFDRVPDDPDPQSNSETRAAQLVAERRVHIYSVDAGSTTVVRGEIDGRRATYVVECGLDDFGRVVSGSCRCEFFQRHALNRGPCSHVLAMRLLHLTPQGERSV